METKRFELKALNYSLEALAPVMCAETLELHWGKHLLTYVNNLNNLVVGTEFENADLVTIIKNAEGGIYNNAGQIFNHEMFFDTLSPNPQAAPTGDLAAAIDAAFGSFDTFKKEFEQKGATLFGSGWAFLSKDADNKLVITQESNAGNPLRSNLTPIMVVDVWEHAYYVDYRNRRPEFLSNIWQLIDWAVVEARFAE